MISSEELINKAREAMNLSYAPYSHFTVGAALLCADGSIYQGVNIENASYGASNCAERTAFFKAVSEGKRKFTAIAICGGPDKNDTDFCPPCGICRQVMREFCGSDFRIILAADHSKQIKEYTLSQLLPESFGPDNLN
ncbi:MAG TPA: cytidine deaminase [Lachnospiraceae bacterium]|nr:cytidine deaminase [Lachnospiraceae bacterium]